VTEAVHRENLARYRGLLARRPDRAERELLLRLLEEEEAKYPPLFTLRGAD
jgi:hypothetical protein